MRRWFAVFTLCMGLALLCQTGCGGSGGGNVADNPDADKAAAYEASMKASQEAMNENGSDVVGAKPAASDGAK